jgi:hypothetical protein
MTNPVCRTVARYAYDPLGVRLWGAWMAQRMIGDVYPPMYAGLAHAA